MAETVSVRQRRRRRRVEAGAPRGTRSVALLTAIALSVGNAKAGRSDVSWPHTDELGATAMAVDAAGAMVVTGCSAGGETFYVAKFTALGQQLWRESIHVGALVAEEQGDRGASSTVCTSALSTDAALNIYVAGSIESEADDASDVFVARLAPAGALEWTRTLGTRFADVATSLAVHDQAGSSSVMLGGYSAGNLSLGRESARNCDEASLTTSGPDACDDGFLVRLAAADGTVVWTRSVASPPSTTSGPKRAGETRVFDVVAVNADADSASLVVVGETRGRLTPDASPQQLERRHAGDVFVRHISLETGAPLWTTQLSAGDDAATFCRQPAAAASSSQYTRVYARGRCSVALHGSREISVAATTQGLLSTFPSQQQPYRDACRVSPACTQLFVARLELASGAVAWVRQAVNAAHTVAEGVLALPRDAASDSDPGDVVVLGSADAGYFAGSAESMEQLAVLRVAGRDGLVRWTAELGLAGEDHAVALGGSRDGALLVAAHGSADKARRGQASAQSFVKRLRASDGTEEPLCVDTIGFDTSQRNATTAALSGEPSARRVVAVPLRRDDATRCVGAAASVRYRYRFVSDATASPSSVVGLVEFTATQKRISIAVAVPPEAVALRVSLESVGVDVRVDEAAREWLVDLVGRADHLAGEIPNGDGDDTAGGGAADGRLWQQLTWVALVGAVVATALVVAAGRLVCWRAPAWAWRRAKLFQYSTLRLRRHREQQQPQRGSEEDPAHAEEAEELRSHLEEIQQLNDSLDGLLLAAAHGASPSSASPRSPAAVELSSSPPASRPKMVSGWRRSLRRVSIRPSSPKKR